MTIVQSTCIAKQSKGSKWATVNSSKSRLARSRLKSETRRKGTASRAKGGCKKTRCISEHQKQEMKMIPYDLFPLGHMAACTLFARQWRVVHIIQMGNIQVGSTSLWALVARWAIITKNAARLSLVSAQRLMAGAEIQSKLKFLPEEVLVAE